MHGDDERAECRAKYGHTVIALVQAPRIRSQLTLPFRRYCTIQDALQSHTLDVSIDDIALVLSRRGQLSELNLTGALIWEVLAQPKIYSELADAIKQHFDVDAEDWEVDLQALLFRLIDLRLVEIREPEFPDDKGKHFPHTKSPQQEDST